MAGKIRKFWDKLRKPKSEKDIKDKTIGKLKALGPGAIGGVSPALETGSLGGSRLESGTPRAAIASTSLARAISPGPISTDAGFRPRNRQLEGEVPDPSLESGFETFGPTVSDPSSSGFVGSEEQTFEGSGSQDFEGEAGRPGGGSGDGSGSYYGASGDPESPPSGGPIPEDVRDESFRKTESSFFGGLGSKVGKWAGQKFSSIREEKVFWEREYEKELKRQFTEAYPGHLGLTPEQWDFAFGEFKKEIPPSQRQLLFEKFVDASKRDREIKAEAQRLGIPLVGHPLSYNKQNRRWEPDPSKQPISKSTSLLEREILEHKFKIEHDQKQLETVKLTRSRLNPSKKSRAVKLGVSLSKGVVGGIRSTPIQGAVIRDFPKTPRAKGGPLREMGFGGGKLRSQFFSAGSGFPRQEGSRLKVAGSKPRGVGSSPLGKVRGFETKIGRVQGRGGSGKRSKFPIL